MKLQSDYALLDVRHGRKKLAKELSKGKVPVIIYGEIDCPFGHDDGESVEFIVTVNKVEVTND